MELILGLGVIAGAVVAVVRRLDVRLALLAAGFALGALAGRPQAILQKFFATLVAPEFVVPICSAMGFAFVLRHTGCDRHLVHLLARPLRRARLWLIPGAVCAGFVVNIPIISQTSAAVAVGSVLVPLLLAARLSRATTGAALLLGASLGGELLNQGAPEYRTVFKEISALGLPPPSGTLLVRTMLPLVLLHLALCAGVFWMLGRRAERAAAPEPGESAEPSLLKVQPLKAMVPLLPLAILFVVGEPLRLLPVPEGWLVGPRDPATTLQRAAEALGEPAYRHAVRELFDSRLIGTAMLIGATVAALTDRRGLAGSARAFFEGAGYAMTHILSIIVAASCFGEGVREIGLAARASSLLHATPALLVPVAAFVPMAFAALAGSGMAATQSLYGLFAGPAVQLGVPPELVGAVVSLGAAAGRTMSPVAAVTLMCASLSETDPVTLVKRVALPLLVGITAVVMVASVLAWR